MMTGQQPIVNPEMMMEEGAAGPPELGENMAANNPTLKEASNVGLPQMPKNPLTGEQFNQATGGL